MPIQPKGNARAEKVEEMPESRPGSVSGSPGAKPTRLIVNADDLGASVETNDTIFALMRQGHITSATLLANGRAVGDAARRAQEYPQCSFGVHLNLTEFRPLTQDPGLEPLLDDEGSFAKQGLRSTRITPCLREALLAELCAQVERVKALGVRISHFDSHHHIHTIPAMFGVLKKVQRRFGVRKVRVSMNVYAEPQPSLLLAKKAVWNWALRHCYRTITTQIFTSLETFLAVGAGLSRLPSSAELMTHPGAPGSEAETEMLRSLRSARWPAGVELISYHQL